MLIKAKLRRIGNSQGVYIPKEVITGYTLGEEIEIDVITKQEESINNGQKVITPDLNTKEVPQKYETAQEIADSLPNNKCPKCHELMTAGKCLYCGTEANPNSCINCH